MCAIKHHNQTIPPLVSFYKNLDSGSVFVYCHTAACTIYLGADRYGVNESCQHDLCRRSTYISFVDGSQTFVLDKEALERHQSTCSLFVFSPSAPTRCAAALKHASVAKHCEVFAVCGCEFAAPSLCFYVRFIGDNCRLESCQALHAALFNVCRISQRFSAVFVKSMLLLYCFAVKCCV